eukprot:scaffold2086_cov133-Isochrysis_galbana.AAC.2
MSRLCNGAEMLVLAPLICMCRRRSAMAMGASQKIENIAAAAAQRSTTSRDPPPRLRRRIPNAARAPTMMSSQRIC